MSSYHSPRRLLDIDLNQQILHLDDMMIETPKPSAFALSQSFSYSSSSSSSPSHLLCPTPINLNRDGGDCSDQKELVAQILKEGNENLSSGKQFEMLNFTESSKLTSYNRIKLSFGREKDEILLGHDASERNCITECSAKSSSSSQKRSTRRMSQSGELVESTDHHPLSSSLVQGGKDWRESSCQAADTTSDTVVRVCSDCNTTRTPLWRSGPRGPKSLCNACGIRQRKVRRAMEAPEAAVAGSSGSAPAELEMSTLPAKTKMNKKEKRPTDRLSLKNKNKLKSKGRRRKNHDLKEGMFPQEEENAAILLMALSYGLFVDSGRRR